jgi:tRNA(fMet)-specific endonuclease VapC
VNYLLDTNAVIAIISGKPEAVRSRLDRIKARSETIATSSIVLFELWYGIARSKRWKENALGLRIFLEGTPDVCSFTAEDARAAGDLRTTLEADGKPIGPYDLLIAAQAVRASATLVTSDVGEFSRVPGLDWQDWSKD